MELELHVRGTEVAQTLRRYAERRFRFALRRFAHRVRRLRIYIADLNGPRGGIDKRCRILAEVAPSGSLVLEETDVHVYEAMDRAADRLRRCVRRDLKRRQARRLGKVHAGSIRYPATSRVAQTAA
jgi:ribosome hibernation promoting factor